MKVLTLSLALAVVAGSVHAQSTNSASVQMVLAAQSEGIRGTLMTQQAIAVTADGRLWTTAYWYSTATTPTAREMRLYESTDHGKSWSQVSKARIANAADASLAVDPDGSTLHVAYQGRANASATYEWSIYHGTFDTKTKTWIGTDTAVFLASGTSSSNQVTWPNVAVNSSGLVLVSGMKSSGWSAYFKIWDGNAWSSETKVQGGSYSKCHNVQAGPDDCFHFAYQSGGTYTAYYRRYDPTTKSFGAEGEILVKAGISNDMKLAISPSGDIFMAYITSAGSAGANPGTIEVAHAKIGSWTFTTYPIYSDTRTPHVLTWGNYTFYCVQLARSGDRTMVCYTIPDGTPSGAKTYPGPLYAQDWTGSGFGPQRTLVASTPNSEITFPVARSDMNSGRGLMLVWARKIFDNATPPNLVGTALSSLVEPAVVADHGLSCRNAAGDMPTSMGDDIPYIGNAMFGLTLRNGTSGSAAVALVGASRSQWATIPLPFDLSPFGWTGCKLYTDILLSIPVPIAANGEAKLPFPIPNTPSLSGVTFNTQWLFLDGAQLRFSNAGMAYVQL